MYYKSKDSWKRLEGEKVCYSFSILTLFPYFSSAPCPHSRTENNVNPVSLEIHLLSFNFWKRWVTRIKSIIFNFVKKKIWLFLPLCSQPKLGHNKHLAPWGCYELAAAVHQLENKKIHSKQVFIDKNLYSPGDCNHPYNVDLKLPNTTAGHREKSHDWKLEK